MNFCRTCWRLSPGLYGGKVVDVDDLPYIAAAKELGLPIYSQDRH